ncbi:hypothetical protein [Luteimonas aestuarii]|nr:hypothetical protein [Luteimonas aestuarii]
MKIPLGFRKNSGNVYPLSAVLKTRACLAEYAEGHMRSATRDVTH